MKEKKETMTVFKRNGDEVAFDLKKVEIALHEANMATEDDCRASALELLQIRDNVYTNFKYLYTSEPNKKLSVEDVQRLVVNAITRFNKPRLL